MTTGSHAPRRGRLAVAASVALAALLGGCVTYTPSQLSAMSAVDICELQYMQGPNLTPESRQAIHSELSRRQDNCRNHAIEVARRYDEFMWHEVYGSPDDP